MSVVPFEPRHIDTRRTGPGAVIDLVGDYWQLAERISATEFVPKSLRNRPEAVLAALLSGAERGLGPMESLRSVHVIEGRPGLYAEAMRALVLAAGHEFEIVETTATRAAVMGRRAGAERWSPQFIWTLDRARRARLASKPTWQMYPESMLLARATTDCCRAVFADVIAGLASVEELEDLTAPEPATTRRQPTRRQPARRRTTPTIASAPTAPATESPPQTPQPPTPAATDLGGIPGADQPSWAPGGNTEPAQPADPAIARRIHAELAQAFPGATGAERDRWRHALVAVVTRRRPDGPQTSSTGISLEEQLALSKLVTNITAGQATVADGPDDTIEVRPGAGWLYTIRLDPVEVTVDRPGEQPAGEGDVVEPSTEPSPATGEAEPPVTPSGEASPDKPRRRATTKAAAEPSAGPGDATGPAEQPTLDEGQADG
jgi:hypothetical protein